MSDKFKSMLAKFAYSKDNMIKFFPNDFMIHDIHLIQYLNMKEVAMIYYYGDKQITLYRNDVELILNADDIFNIMNSNYYNHYSIFDKDDLFIINIITETENQYEIFFTEKGIITILAYCDKELSMFLLKLIKDLNREHMEIEMEMQYKKQMEEYKLQVEEYKNKIEKKTFENIRMTGFVYVLKTDSIECYKIGKTSRTVNKRIKNLQTGNVNDILNMFEYETCNEDLLEKLVHFLLDKYRINREFFKCDLNYIINIIKISGKMIEILKSSSEELCINEILRKISIDIIESMTPLDELCERFIDMEF